MYRFLAKFLFLSLALPAIFRAAIRVNVLYARNPLDKIPDKLRDVAVFRCRFLKNPSWLNGSVGQLLWCLPPFGMGPCLKRSLYILDLWSRCGLEPTMTLGLAKDQKKQRFHAWITERSATDLTRPGYHTLWTL